jgi:hypothetical protein
MITDEGEPLAVLYEPQSLCHSAEKGLYEGMRGLNHASTCTLYTISPDSQDKSGQRAGCTFKCTYLWHCCGLGKYQVCRRKERRIDLLSWAKTRQTQLNSTQRVFSSTIELQLMPLYHVICPK